MTQFTGRKEDVQVFIKSMSPAPAGVGRSGRWEEREREERRDFRRTPGGVNEYSSCFIALVHEEQGPSRHILDVRISGLWGLDLISGVLDYEPDFVGKAIMLAPGRFLFNLLHIQGLPGASLLH